MRKLRLVLDNLLVESFDTTGTGAPRGTVVGEQCSCGGTCVGQATCGHTCAYTCDDPTCPACPTCAASCNGTCDACGSYDSCGDTCFATCGDTCFATCGYSCMQCPNTSAAFPCYIDP